MNRIIVATLVAVSLFSGFIPAAVGQSSTSAPAKPEGKPAVGEARQVTMRGTISAIDMPAWPPWPWPCASSARCIAAWSWAAASIAAVACS